MVVIANTIRIQKGGGDRMVERFENRERGFVEGMPGFISVSLLQLRGTEEHDEIIVHSLWESKEAHDSWMKTEEFRKAHSGPRSEGLIDFKIRVYDVLGHRNAEPQAESLSNLQPNT
ncbi:antibiotic biosynthesis monooxygenase family protein [Paenibacillus sp. 481]|uniref:antibiotic biosynthesis monooxygenase family protein n=1 Tax=Paenibacillus sp. 481 TaxID=2835869 RepID=UPI001E31E2A7|nr:antibiotic biosynthesis monooxygenase [Paenibacillus sp. 481]UHA73534.1 antibiotic biosynthesis monooxygenase [Paenibacillus sp. 481]